MAHNVVEFDRVCINCRGTGPYSGMGESKETAVVCHTCKGTGCDHVRIEYDDFEGLVERDDIEHVYETNPGIKVGKGGGYVPSDFGGMSYKEWLSGVPFKPGMENRRFTCPAWWYQIADYDKKPRWERCIGIGRFSNCDHFNNKRECWDKWDKEFGGVN